MPELKTKAISDDFKNLKSLGILLLHCTAFSILFVLSLILRSLLNAEFTEFSQRTAELIIVYTFYTIYSFKDIKTH